MIREILLVHHTHTDIGYTHPQPAVFELHDRYIEAALDLADDSEAQPDESRFRWTCEVTGTTRSWWDRAGNQDRDRFLAAVGRGQIEVAALEWHMTPLADLRMLLRGLENVRFFRDLGIPVHSAMQTDVNGAPWGLVDILLDHGIDGFSMAINAHLGDAVSPRPGAFRWQGPDGRSLLVWNGFQYWHAANVLLRMPSSVEAVAEALPGFLDQTQRRGYSLSYLPLQITNPHHPDNAGPDPSLSNFVREWNARDPEVRIRTVLLTEIFNRLRREELPLLTGDWTDYWNLGAGSSARETTVLTEGLRTLDAAHEVRAWSPESERREADHLDQAHRDLSLYAEHTWGADCSITQPDSIETQMQWSIKSSFAYEGLGHARIVLRDGLHRLAEEAGGEEPTLLLFNPLSIPVRTSLRLPVKGLEWPLTRGVHHRQRLDGALGNLQDIQTRWCDVTLPPFGYRTYPVDSLKPSSSTGLAESAGKICSSRVRIHFDLDVGGIQSLQVDDAEYVGLVDGLTFGIPVLERPAGGSRREIMSLDFSRFDLAEGWNPGWERMLVPGKLLESQNSRTEGAVEHLQTFSMENGDTVKTLYRLFAEAPTLDVEVMLGSAGDQRPYSLALPFVLPAAGETTWHFDTAGALVEFDREQLPNACRHFVTARRFVRMSTAEACLAIATPDLPLWKFGGMFFEPSNKLDSRLRRPVTLAWLANNYWEVNFLANQFGRSKFRFRLIPGVPESVETSYQRALPYAVPPRLHTYREMGAVRHTERSLLNVVGESVVVDAISRKDNDLFLVVSNLKSEANSIQLKPDALTWTESWRAKLDGTPKQLLVAHASGTTPITLVPRETIGVLLNNMGYGRA